MERYATAPIAHGDHMGARRAAHAAGAAVRLAAAHRDEDLIARVCAGDHAAFAAIMQRYNQRLYRTARAVLRDDAEAEDVLQETYFRALTHLGSFRGEASLCTWLTRIAVHLASARLRRRRHAGALDDLDAAAAGPTPEKGAYDRELRGALEAAIDRLPAGLRLVFVLRAVEGLSTAETARVAGISAMNVKVRLHRARALLRRSLAAGGGHRVDDAFEFAGRRCARVVATVLARLRARP